MFRSQLARSLAPRTVRSGAAHSAVWRAASTGATSATSAASSSAKTVTAVAQIDGKTFTLNVGDEFGRATRQFSQDEVKEFAALIRDANPLHVDAKFAATTRFRKPIVPGMLVSGLFSSLLGSAIPGTIYVSQSLNFLRPVLIDEPVTAVVKIESLDRKFVKLHTAITKENNELAVEGEAVVYIPSIGVDL